MKKTSRNHILTLLLAGAFSFPSFSFGLELTAFKEKLDKQIGRAVNKDGLSIYMEVLGTRQALFSYNENTRLLPASSTKLITTLASLEKLGPAYSYETKIYRKGEDLIFAGSGDPYLVSERLWLIARDIARAGIKSVRSIRVNNSKFSEDYKGLIEWDGSGEPFTAIVSPASLNFNSLELHVIPMAGEKKAKVEVGPVVHKYAKIVNNVSVVSGSRRNISVKSIKSEVDREIIEVSGTIGRDSAPAIEYISVNMPEAYLASVLAAMLREEGIAVEKDFDGITWGPVESDAKLIASQESLPLLEQVRLLNTFSNNFMTEQVFQAFGAAVMGGAASIEKSRQAALSYLKQKEACRDAELDNGSGLSWKTRVSSKCFVDLMQNSYRDFRVFADFIGSLPIGGETGTLKKRFKNAASEFEPWKVRAKTGTLWSQQAVTSLVGFTQTASKELVAFAILQNDSKPGPDKLQTMRDWEDKCVEFIQQLKL